jgi:hypothetical protein
MGACPPVRSLPLTLGRQYHCVYTRPPLDILIVVSVLRMQVAWDQ